jgi:hypothetical protein
MQAWRFDINVLYAKVFTKSATLSCHLSTEDVCLLHSYVTFKLLRLLISVSVCLQARLRKGLRTATKVITELQGRGH